MTFDFDVDIDRTGTNSIKWEFHDQDGQLRHWDRTRASLGDERLLPMWIADMDFRCPQPVIDAIMTRAAHGIFGYSEKTDSYLEAVTSWMLQRHGWHVNPEWIVTTPGVVPALHMAVKALSQPGDKVLVQGPVYYPFYDAITRHGAEVVSNSLRLHNERYEMDFDHLDDLLSDPQVKLAILCSPHNPVGRVWSATELHRFGMLCAQHGVFVIADEIHADLVYPESRFTPYASLSEAHATQAITCTAASKSFNLAGLQTSNIIIPDPNVRASFRHVLQQTGLYGMNPFGIVATEAAYRHGAAWLSAVMAYITENRDRALRFFKEHLPEIVPIKPDATYLLWLDCRPLGLDDAALTTLMFERAKIYLDDGHLFGPEGIGFQRVNLACSRHVLEQVLERLQAAIRSL